MVISKAKTVTEYLESLSEEQLGIIAPVHRMLLGKLPKGVVEVMNWGMICVTRSPLAWYQKPTTANHSCLRRLLHKKTIVRFI